MQDVYENKMQLEILSKSSNEAFAGRVTVAAFASQLDLNIEELADIKNISIRSGY